MERNLKRIFSYLPTIIAFLLFIMPFFWLKPGEMDLGGDSSRLYYYDPLSYLTSHTLTGISPSNLGGENIGYYVLPFNLILLLMKGIFVSPTLLIGIINGVNFSVAFVAVFLIVKEILIMSKITKKKVIINLTSIFGGIYYIFSFNSILGWDKTLITHNQFFVNPLIFVLLLFFLTRHKFIYLLFALLFTFIFSFSFSFAGAPGFFSFFPISILFLLILKRVVLREGVQWAKVIFSVILFMGLQAFHIFPQIVSLATPGSVGYANIFSSQGKFDRGLSYFLEISKSIKVSTGLFHLPQLSSFQIIYVFSAFLFLVIIISLFFSKNKTHIITAAFFIVVLFFYTANITFMGFTLYKSLFNIPGFSMFRNYFGQWAFTYLFFYTLLLSLSFSVFFDKVKNIKTPLIVVLGSILLLLINAWPLINGEYINPSLWQSNNIHIVTKFDKSFENSIDFVRKLPDGKFLTLPLSDPGYQIIVGPNRGAYQGPSTIAYLAGKKDFASQQELGRYALVLANAFKEKDYKKVDDIFSILNISYIYYDSNPLAYTRGFSNFPFYEVRKNFPENQEEYKKLLRNLNYEKIFGEGSYSIYKVPNTLPHIYSPKKIERGTDEENNLSFYMDLYDFSKDRIAIVNGQDIQGEYEQLEAVDEKDISVTDFPINTVYPFVKWSPKSLIYPFVLWREEKEINGARVDEERIGLETKSAFKRISELEKWGNEMPVESNKNGTSWHTNLNRYKDRINDAIVTIDKSNSSQWKYKKRLWLRVKLEHNYKKIVMIIGESSLDKSEKSKLYQYSKETIDKLISPLGELRDGNFQYFVNSPLNGTYEVLISKQDAEAHFDKLTYDKKTYEIVSSGDYLKTKQPIIFRDNGLLQLLQSSKTNDRIYDWYSSKNLIATDNIVYKDKLEFDETRKSYILPIYDWQQNSRYAISFEYNTYEQSFETSLFLRYGKNDATKNRYTALFREKINSNGWSKFFAIIDTENSKDPIFEINALGEDISKRAIDIRNVSITEVPRTPTIFLHKVNIDDRDISASISYERINPTKYKVHVKNIKEPFFLILLDEFNNGWKIRDDKGILSFFNKPVAQNRHFQVFGYANGWEITPDEIDGKKEATFILEFDTQKRFYFGLFVSTISLLVLLSLIMKESIYPWLKKYF